MSVATDEWLTIPELAQRLGYAERTVRKKMRDGTWRKGEVWFKRDGSRPLFWWAAVVAWLTAPEADVPKHGAAFDRDLLPSQRGRAQLLS